MSNIRRQSIISSVIVYFGFVLGFINTYLFTKKGSFTAEQFGLVNEFMAIANVMFSFAHLGVPAVIYKFYPYYKDNLDRRKNDLVTWSLVISAVGFVIVGIVGYLMKDIVVKKFITNAPDLVKYYHWLFPFGFGLTVYSVLEAYAWQERRSVLSNFLREVLFRVFTTILIVCFFMAVIPSFDRFIKLYACTYILLAAVLMTYFITTKRIHFHFSISRVSRKFYRKISLLAAFTWSGGLVYNIANSFDSLVIASVLPDGMAQVAVYSLGFNIASLIQAPQRGIIAASISPLSQAWKDKNMAKISQIYSRSAINQLIFAVAMFSLILMNFDDGIHTFKMKPEYTSALTTFLFIGLWRVMDLGTGLNSQIIATSTYWRFEFFTGVILLALALPLNYTLTKSMGIMGTAISNLVAFTTYNFIRFVFLWKRLKLQPFSIKTVYAVVVGMACLAACYFVFRSHSGLIWIIARSSVFLLLYCSLALYLNISPDVRQILQVVRNRMRRII